MTVFAIVSYTIYFINFVKDFYYINELKNKKISSRSDIVTFLSYLKTSKGRLYFVMNLQDSGIIPSGQWPDGRIPNWNNDESSTLLSKMEERWLRLDRY